MSIIADVRFSVNVSFTEGVSSVSDSYQSERKAVTFWTSLGQRSLRFSASPDDGTSSVFVSHWWKERAAGEGMLVCSC